MNNTFIQAALYARVSSQKQADNNTIASQYQAIVQRIESDGLSLAKENAFCDEGFSGAVLLRPALEILRDRIAASVIDRLYIHSPDRLARKMAHQALLLEEFAKHGCEVVFLNQQGMPDSPETNLLIQMQGIIAEYEREKILERTRRGRRHSAAAGNVSVFGGAPYGYRYVSKWQGDGKARWEIDPVKSQHVQLMFELVGRRGFTLSAVVRELSAQSIRTETGKATWQPATIRGILTNSAYYGEARYGKERLVERKPGKRAKRGDPATPRQAKVTASTDPSSQMIITVPGIVDQSLFQQVKKQMDENRKRQRARQKQSEYLLSGLTLCGICGSAYCARRMGDGKYFYYRCIGTEKHRHAGQAICDNGSVKGKELERAVWSELVNLLNEPSRLQAELERRRADQRPNDRLQRQQREVEDLRGRLDRLIDAYESGLIDRAEFESRVAPLRDRHNRESASLSSLLGEVEASADVDSAQQALAALADDVRGRLASADETLQRQLLKLLIKRIEIHADEIRIVYKVPQSPFLQSPGKRGFFQHCLRRHVIAWDDSPT